MKPLPASLAIAGLAAAFLGAPSIAQEASPAPAGGSAALTLPAGPVDRITMDADHYAGNADAQILTATGHVTATLTQPDPRRGTRVTVVTADSATADFRNRILTAEGRVAVTSDGRTALGDHLVYRWDEQSGQVQGVFAREYGVTFRAGELRMTPLRQEALDASLTACGEDNPGYVLRARRVVIVPNRRITMNGVSVEVLGHRLARVRSLTYRLQSGSARNRHQLPVARPGYSRLSGFTLAQPVPMNGDVYLEVEATTRQGVRGRTDWEGDGAVRPFVEAEWKREYPVATTLPVLVSRLPEAGLRFGRRDDLTLAAGYMQEHSTRTSAGRAIAAWRHNLLDRGSRPGLSLRVDARASAYSTGDRYAAAGFVATLGRGDRDVFDEIGVAQHGVNGKSPFLWDRVLVQSEVFAGKRIASRKFGLEANVHYDVVRNRVWEWQAAVSRRFRCIEPEIRYSSRRRLVYLNLRVAGFGEAQP